MMQRREPGSPPAMCPHCRHFMCYRAITGKCGLEPPPPPLPSPPQGARTVNYEREQALKREAEAYFNALPPERRVEVEMMYRAFRCRLMSELRVEGGTNQGVVYGKLTDR